MATHPCSSSQSAATVCNTRQKELKQGRCEGQRDSPTSTKLLHPSPIQRYAAKGSSSIFPFAAADPSPLSGSHTNWSPFSLQRINALCESATGTGRKVALPAVESQTQPNPTAPDHPRLRVPPRDDSRCCRHKPPASSPERRLPPVQQPPPPPLLLPSPRGSSWLPLAPTQQHHRPL